MPGDNYTMHVPENGQAGVEENELYLFSSGHKMSVNIQQDIHPFGRGGILKLSADMKCENIQLGEKPWDLARLLLALHDGHKDRWDLPHLVASFSGIREWNNYGQFFTIGPETKKIRVVAQLDHSTGSFWLKNLCLYPVTQTKLYPWIKSGILVSCGLFAVFLLGSCFFHGNQKIVIQR